MNNKKIVLSVFILIALIQLYVPSRMIWSREAILKRGTEYRFRTAPIDPTDPFRGKYIILNFEDNTTQIESGKNWASGEQIYVYLTTNNNGFAVIKSVSKEKPIDNQPFVNAKVSFITGNDSGKLVIDYPFNRFYMEESKAYEAELLHTESQQDSSKITYALVSIKNGNAVLKDVLIDGVSISEAVIKSREEIKK